MVARRAYVRVADQSAGWVSMHWAGKAAASWVGWRFGWWTGWWAKRMPVARACSRVGGVIVREAGRVAVGWV